MMKIMADELVCDSKPHQLNDSYMNIFEQHRWYSRRGKLAHKQGFQVRSSTHTQSQNMLFSTDSKTLS